MAEEGNIVLVVDDEPLILRVASIALAEAGFAVEVADSARAGLEVFTQLRDEIRIVVADVVMPLASGLEMVEKIRKIDPHMKILMMSGYADRAVEVEKQGKFPFIRKPFLLEDFIAKIRSLLAESNSASATQP